MSVVSADNYTHITFNARVNIMT